ASGAGLAWALDGGFAGARLLGSARCSWSVALRSLAAIGPRAVRPDPDWTAEVACRSANATLHAAVTRDLGGVEPGVGMELDARGVRVLAGARGAPWSWSLGVSVARGGAGLALGRSSHPTLG